MQKLTEEIKTGQLKQVYILYGEEAYLRSQYKDKLKKALLGDGDDMNFHYFEGKNISQGEVIDLAETMPFFAQRRVIVLENSGLMARGGEELAAYLGNPAQTAYFVFVEQSVDKRSRLYKAATARGRAIEFKAQDEAVLKRWILGFLKKENKNITERDLNFFLDKTGSGMDNIRGELEKLFCYCMGRDVITAQDIEAVADGRPGIRFRRHIPAVVAEPADEAIAARFQKPMRLQGADMIFDQDQKRLPALEVETAQDFQLVALHVDREKVDQRGRRRLAEDSVERLGLNRDDVFGVRARRHAVAGEA